MTWFIRRPSLFQQEVAELASQFKTFIRCQGSYEKGMLAYRGMFRWHYGNTKVEAEVLLHYPDDFPYRPPLVYPLNQGAPTDLDAASLLGTDHIRKFSVRHQMPHGWLCLFEMDGREGDHRHIGGTDALRRAKKWLQDAIRGHFSTRLDSHGADLDAHYKKQGDIIVGPAAYKGLVERGRFLAINLRLESDEHPLYGMLHMEAPDAWLNDVDRIVQSGLTIPDHLTDLIKHPNDLWTQAPQTDRVLRGYWYTLLDEPPPVQTPEALAKLLYPHDTDPLAAISRDFAVERHTHALLVFALRFPARDNEPPPPSDDGAPSWDWLFLTLQMRAKNLEAPMHNGHRAVLLGGEETDIEPLQNAELGVLRKQDIRPRKLLLRNRGRVPQEVAGLKLALLGAGALGSMCADLLVKSGVGHLTICDSGFFDAGNVIRHLGTLRCLGYTKSAVTRSLIQSHNPDCEVTAIHDNALCLEDGADLWKDPIVSTIANDATELAFNQRAVLAGSTVYYLRALRSGSAARLIRVRPGKDACFECVAIYMSQKHPDAILVPPAENEVITHECGQAVLAASAADLAVVAGMGVRQILTDTTTQDEVNQWVWTSEGISGHNDLSRPGSMRTTILPPHPECQICSRGAVTKIRLPAAVCKLMVDLTTSGVSSETGGLLVGRRIGGVVHILAASGPGPKASQNPTRFIRDGEYSQTFLDAAIIEHGDGAEYVGEWHSHPNSSAAPSMQDVKSLGEIAFDTNYLTPCPIMLIVGRHAAGDIDMRGYSHPQDLGGKPVPARLELGREPE